MKGWPGPAGTRGPTGRAPSRRTETAAASRRHTHGQVMCGRGRLRAGSRDPRLETLGARAPCPPRLGTGRVSGGRGPSTGHRHQGDCLGWNLLGFMVICTKVNICQKPLNCKRGGACILLFVSTKPDEKGGRFARTTGRLPAPARLPSPCRPMAPDPPGAAPQGVSPHGGLRPVLTGPAASEPVPA